MPKWTKTFLNDDDGFSAKDFIMVAFCGVYLTFLVGAFVLAVLGRMPAELLGLISSMTGVVMTIIGGVFAIQTVQSFTHRSAGTDGQYSVPEPEQEPQSEARV
ncbi:hypothetical protein ACP26L_36260 (plasmid) [Paenibacillus sp. S-38]|uniref:hypothetical protein n=1 Tax=Paenibacillus sp. S-38 TaxID=3416710 RepID=UPI003CFAB10C